MKVVILHAEHFSDPGAKIEVFAKMEDARLRAVELCNGMLSDTENMFPVCTAETLEQCMMILQEEHGAQHCFIDLTESDVVQPKTEKFSVIVTRDITESCVIEVEAENEDDAGWKALEVVRNSDPEWKVDDPSPNNDAYVTGTELIS